LLNAVFLSSSSTINIILENENSLS
jgi:hypothetical protein